jgi:hypothetical protein
MTATLVVEIVGFGICNTEFPYSVLAICVQQESFQAWTVFRRYTTFVQLYEQLKLGLNLHSHIISLITYVLQFMRLLQLYLILILLN